MERKGEGGMKVEREGGREVGYNICSDTDFASHDHDSQLLSLVIR